MTRSSIGVSSGRSPSQSKSSKTSRPRYGHGRSQSGDASPRRRGRRSRGHRDRAGPSTGRSGGRRADRTAHPCGSRTRPAHSRGRRPSSRRRCRRGSQQGRGSRPVAATAPAGTAPGCRRRHGWSRWKSSPRRARRWRRTGTPALGGGGSRRIHASGRRPRAAWRPVVLSEDVEGSRIREFRERRVKIEVTQTRPKQKRDRSVL